MNHTIQLCKLPLNCQGKIDRLNCSGNIRRRFLDLGLIEGTFIKPILVSPSGDPTAYCLRGSLIALRQEDSKLIDVVV